MKIDLDLSVSIGPGVITIATSTTGEFSEFGPELFFTTEPSRRFVCVDGHSMVTHPPIIDSRYEVSQRPRSREWRHPASDWEHPKARRREVSDGFGWWFCGVCGYCVSEREAR